MKFTVNGETFSSSWALGHVSMADALAIEKVANRRYVEWETEFLHGSAEALAVFVVLAWQRDGREVELKSILDGSVEFDFSGTYASVMDALTGEFDARAAAENPTSGAAPLTDPDGTDTTSAATPGSSRSASTSARGKSGS